MTTLSDFQAEALTGQPVDLAMHSVKLDASGIPHPVVEVDLLPNAYGSMPTAEPPHSPGQPEPATSVPSLPSK